MNKSVSKKDAGQADIDAAETADWITSLEDVLRVDGRERAHFLIEQLVDVARQAGSDIPFSATRLIRILSLSICKLRIRVT